MFSFYVILLESVQLTPLAAGFKGWLVNFLPLISFHYKDINQLAHITIKALLSPRRKRVSRFQTIYI